MNWYAAHLIQYFKYREGKQRSFKVWENIVLIHAATAEEAYAKAERIGRDEASIDDESLRIGDHPAKLIFAGIRKVVQCLEPQKRPGDGTEISYTDMVLSSEKAIQQLVAGKSVDVTLEETFEDEVSTIPAAPRGRLAE